MDPSIKLGEMARRDDEGARGARTLFVVVAARSEFIILCMHTGQRPHANAISLRNHIVYYSAEMES